ncbi:MAG: ECF transporter S component [Clostridia bacterium]|nr:ECF transporter S component [Clostridia bacterium]
MDTNRNNVLKITRTAMLLALAVLFQTLFRSLIPVPTVNIFIVGSLVNAVLMIAGVAAGVWGGLAVSILTPVIAYFQGHLNLVWMIPVVAIGNAIIMFIFYLFYNKNSYLGVALGSLIKFIFLLVAVRQLFKWIMGVPNLPALMQYSFSWPQLVTGIIGGIIAILVLRATKNSLEA